LSARYITLAEMVIEKIEAKQFTIGQRMPSIRKFAKLYGISITTALNCYTRLEDQGWLQVKPQSGYFVTQPFGKKAQPQFPLFTACLSQPIRSQPIVSGLDSPFNVSHLAPQLLPQEILTKCARQGQIKASKLFHLYPDYQGLPVLRRNLAKHFSEQYFHLDSETLVITNGCIDAIKTAIEVTSSEGDAIAVSSPCFNGLLALLANMKRMVIEIPCYQSQLDLTQLEDHLKNKSVKACLLSANHINPQGISLSVTQKQKIAELADYYQIPVIEDDIYLELNHTNTPSLPIKHWDKSGWVLWCGSISKSISPSYRLGWCEPGRFFKDYLQYRGVQYLGVNLAVQCCINEFIYSGQYFKHLKKTKLALSQNTRAYHALLSKYLPSNTRISIPKGGLVIWLQIANLNSTKLLEDAKKQGIYFRAGNEFSTLNLYNDCLRINIGWSISNNNEADESSKQRYQQLVKLCQLISSC